MFIIAFLLVALMYSISSRIMTIVERLLFSILSYFVLNGIYSIIISLLNVKVSLISYLLFALLVLILSIPFKYYTGKKSLCIDKNKTNQVFLVTVPYITVTLLSIYVLCCYFGYSIHYESVDPAGHFDMSYTFLKNGELLSKSPSMFMHAYNNYPILFYVNLGIIYKFLPNLQIIDYVFIYNVFNCILFILVGFLLINIVHRISNSKVWLDIIILLVLLAYPLNLLLTGFSSQLLGIVFILGVIQSFLFKGTKDNGNDGLLFRNLSLVGIFLSYHYYFPEVFIAVIVLEYISINKQSSSFLIKFKNYALMLFYKYIWILIVLPIIPIYWSSSRIINVDGTITRDLYSSLLLFVPGLIYFIYSLFKRKYDIINLMLLSSLMFSIILFILTMYGRCSPYYFYKNYILLYFLFGFVTIQYMMEFSTKVILHIISLILVVVGCSFYGKIHSKVLNSANYYILQANRDLINNTPKINHQQLELFSKLGQINKQHDSSCVVGTDPRLFIWFGEVSNGIYYRGILYEQSPWSGNGQAWKDLLRDSTCDDNYKFILDINCKHDNLSLIYSNNEGCIYQNLKYVEHEN